MLAASPLRAMRSAPKTTASTRPRANSCPAGDVGDQRVVDALLGQLPGRETGALQQRPRLVDPDVDRGSAAAAARTTPSAEP